MNYTSTFTRGDPDDSDFIRILHTPYGDTTFKKAERDPTPSSSFWWRSLEITYPDGGGEYVEFNQIQENPPSSDA
jgi:hypothetical protein